MIDNSELVEKRRLELQSILETFPNVTKAWFQPPSNFKMKYPCFKYSYSGHRNLKADNKHYVGFRKYTITYIDPDPTTPIEEFMFDRFEMISMDRTYTADNLNHWVFTLYY